MNLLSDCSHLEFSEALIDKAQSFDCGDGDLNKFLSEQAIYYRKQLLSKTYVFVNNSAPNDIVCYYAVSNDSIRIDGLAQRGRKVTENIPHPKRHLLRFPAVLIGRLGVDIKYRPKNAEKKLSIGKQMVDIIKLSYSDPENKTGCRFVVTDAIKGSIGFYEKCRFEFLHSTIEREKEYFGYSPEEDMDTRFLLFDLLTLLS